MSKPKNSLPRFHASGISFWTEGKQDNLWKSSLSQYLSRRPLPITKQILTSEQDLPRSVLTPGDTYEPQIEMRGFPLPFSWLGDSHGPLPEHRDTSRGQESQVTLQGAYEDELCRSNHTFCRSSAQYKAKGRRDGRCLHRVLLS